MRYEDLTPELKEKVRTCKTPEELLALAKDEGYELSNDDLSVVSGGAKHWGKSYGDTCSSLGCDGYYCHSLYCIQVGLPLPRCGTFDYDYAN